MTLPLFPSKVILISKILSPDILHSFITKFSKPSIPSYFKYVEFGLDFAGDPKQSLMFMLGIRAHCVD